MNLFSEFEPPPPPISVGRALLNAVVADPDNDTPRLVLADWLDESGAPGASERAEFIRVQCALDRLPPTDPEVAAMRARERELLDAHGVKWADAELGPSVQEWVYRRGFVERVETNLEVPAEEIVALLGRAPIRHLRDTSQFSELRGVVDALPRLAGLTGLEFWYLYAFEDKLLGQLLMSPHLAGLRTLVLHHDRNGNMLDCELVAEALSSPHRANLEELAVNVDGTWRGLSPLVLRAVADSPYLRKLRKLNLSNAGGFTDPPALTAELVRALGQSPNLANLEELDFGGVLARLDVWDEVLRWPFLPQLKRLRLSGARQVRSNGYLVAADLRDLPEYRAAFDRAGPVIDWDSDWQTPWTEGCWQGQSNGCGSRPRG